MCMSYLSAVTCIRRILQATYNKRLPGVAIYSSSILSSRFFRMLEILACVLLLLLQMWLSPLAATFWCTGGGCPRRSCSHVSMPLMRQQSVLWPTASSLTRIWPLPLRAMCNSCPTTTSSVGAVTCYATRHTVVSCVRWGMPKFAVYRLVFSQLMKTFSHRFVAWMWYTLKYSHELH
jgi:hypothetical protein